MNAHDAHDVSRPLHPPGDVLALGLHDLNPVQRLAELAGRQRVFRQLECKVVAEVLIDAHFDIASRRFTRDLYRFFIGFSQRLFAEDRDAGVHQREQDILAHMGRGNHDGDVESLASQHRLDTVVAVGDLILVAVGLQRLRIDIARSHHVEPFGKPNQPVHVHSDNISCTNKTNGKLFFRHHLLQKNRMFLLATSY